MPAIDARWRGLLAAGATCAPVLSVDTSGDPASVALFLDDGRSGPQLLGADVPPGSRPSQALHGVVARLLREGSVAPRDLALLAAVRGPGSFTGLRVGLATIRGLSLACGARAVGIDTPAAFALASGVEGLVLVVLDGGQGRTFVASVVVDERRCAVVDGPHDASPEEALAKVAAAEGRALVRGAPSNIAALIGAGARQLAMALAGAAAVLAASGLGREPDPLYARAPIIRPPPSAATP